MPSRCAFMPHSRNYSLIIFIYSSYIFIYSSWIFIYWPINFFCRPTKAAVWEQWLALNNPTATITFR